ncbi:hypothetical protein [Flavivirga jejuensis]|uniref:Uncharacterized protein n=1 Tax=Flavivirga jejuensis TaxID=870487 RepID=A0ABT8WQY9_9FLAO|nr:hypothetical protein [Flavivirga jejuensis]MDO5975592.1 hypothetical protein [Flavivirga jejuensis]
MTRENKWEQLDDLRNVALGDSDTGNLVKEKREIIDKLNHNRPDRSYSLEPSPKPKGDIEIPKNKKEGKEGKDSYQDHINKTRDDYDQKIYETIKQNFESHEFDEYIEQLDELNKTEIGILMENDGANKLLDYQEEKQQELDKTNSDKEPIQEIDVEQSMKLSNEQRDEIIEHGSYIDLDDDSKNKDIDRNKTEKELSDFQKNSKDISDDFE